MQEIIWVLMGVVLAASSLPGTIELLLLTIFGLLLPSRRTKIILKERLKIAVVIPAHNEELSITKAIKSILNCETEHEVKIVVIADNCNDRTGKLAQSVGARVIERTDLKNRGKGPALNFAFQDLLKEGFDAFIMLDADTVVEPNFIAGFARLFQSGADAAQCRYLVTNPNDSTRTRLMNLALLAMHVLRPRGRSRLNISCGIFGNGFGLTRKTLEETPYLADSIVEDLEYHLALVQAGKKVRFVNDATVRAEFPAGGKGLNTQRSRWEGGRLRIVLDKVPFLFREIMKGNYRFIEPLLELLTLPLVFHVLLLAIILTIPVLYVRIYAAAALGVVLLYILSAIIIAGEKRDLFTLLLVPFYVVWKIGRLGGILKTSKKETRWVRTARKEGG